MGTTPGRSRQPPATCALLLIAYLVRDQGDGRVSRGGGILGGVIVFMVGYPFRWLALDRGRR